MSQPIDQLRDATLADFEAVPPHRVAELTLEAYALEGRRWEPRGTWRDSDRVRITPFDAIELDLGDLWPD